MKKKKKKQFNKDFFNYWLFLLFILFLPTQLGKHLFFSFSYLSGVRVDYLSPTIYLTDMIVFFLFFLNLKNIFIFFKNKKLIFLFILFLINIFFAKNQLIAFYRFIKIIEFLIVFYFAREFLLKIKEKTLLLIFFIFSSFQFLLSIFQMIYKHSFQGIFYFFGERNFYLSTPGIAKAIINGNEFLRPYGTFSHPNSMAGFFLLLYCFILVNQKFNKHLFLKYFLLFISSFLIFFSFSKIAIFTFLLINFLYLIFYTKINCLICKISRLIVPSFLSFVFFQATTDVLTVEKRIELIKNSLNIFLENPIFGVGLGNYLIAQEKFNSKFFLFFHQPVHNIFLLFIAETGIVISGFLIFQFLKILKIFKIKKEFWLIFLTVFITGFFDHYWLTLQQNFLLLGLIYGAFSKSFFILRLRSRS